MKESDNNSQIPEDENKLVALRREKLHAIRQKREAYPNGFQRKSTAKELISEYVGKEKAELEELVIQTSIAGRIIRIRGPFLVIVDGGVKIQLYLNSKILSDELLDEFKLLDLGDIIGVEGVVF